MSSSTGYRAVPVDGEDEDDVHVSEGPSDRRMMWMHFALGCAVLLPWNGAIFPARAL
jgi:hypothetical protein